MYAIVLGCFWKYSLVQVVWIHVDGGSKGEKRSDRALCHFAIYFDRVESSKHALNNCFYQFCWKTRYHGNLLLGKFFTNYNIEGDSFRRRMINEGIDIW